MLPTIFRENGEFGVIRPSMALKFHMGGRTLSGKIACACCSWILLSLATKFSAAAQTNVVVVRPKPIHNVLVNPGMGITTFQRFNGQELNPPLKWSEVGPVTKLPQAATKPRRCTSYQRSGSRTNGLGISIGQNR